MFSFQRKPRRKSAHHRNCNHYLPLSFERLEDRRVLSTVTTQAGLIAAINAANAAGGNNTITLGKNITIYETTADNDNQGPNGLPSITSGDNLTIKGNGHTLQRSSSAGNADFRFFLVGPGATLTLKTLSLKNGLISEYSGNLEGGAIFVGDEGTLNLSAVIVSGNSVNNEGSSTNTEADGGAIYNSGTTNISASIITNNSATISILADAGQGNGDGSNLTADDSGNNNDNGSDSSLNADGGAIYNIGTLTISSSSILKNSATITVTNGSKTPPGSGNSDGDDVTGTNNGNGDGNGVAGEVTVVGGGIYNNGTVTLTADALVGNWARSSVTNGSNNGNDNGDNAGIQNGTADGNGITGSVSVQGGGLANLSNATLKADSFVGNWAASAVINGSNNGNDNGDNDTADINDAANGSTNGNGVGADITVQGGAIYNSSDLTANTISVVANYANSTVTNGSNNGNGNGVMTEDNNGNNNGNGVNGDVTVSGGGIENDRNSTATISRSTVSANWAGSTISNGNNNGDGDGDNNAGLGNNEGKNNGNGVAGFVHISGGGIDNETGASLTITSSAVSANAIRSTISNGNNNGNMDGNDDGDGDALASIDSTVDVLVLHGSGIRNDGDLTISSTVVSANSITSTIRNGNNDGNNTGDNDAEDKDGRANGNAVSGDVLFAGAGIANSGTMDLTKGVLTANSISSSIANGTGDGNEDGQNDGANNDCGINCGDAVFGDVEIDGGGIGNSGTASVHSSTIAGNLLTSTVTNGKNNGQDDGTGSTGTDGQGDGNGIDGNLEVVGGGTSNAGTLTFDSTTVKGNVIHSSPNTGGNDTTLDGKVINGTVTVSGANSF